MAENIFNDSAAKAAVEREHAEDDTYKQIKEISVREREKKSSKCESCVSEGRFKTVAVFLCLVCEIYVCVKCRFKHKSHGGMEVWREKSDRHIKKEESERKTAASEREKEREESKSDRIKEQREKEKMLGQFVTKLMNESDTERRKELKNSHVSVCDQVEVKHKLDQDEDCWISGLCGLEDRRLVVCDVWNSCIKIFKLGSYVLQRYIEFVDYLPWDVTEIDLKQNSTEPNLVSGSSSDISTTDRADPDKKCLIAVTLPNERQIMFIDLSKKSAEVQKMIKTEETCYSIQFYDNKIFTGCTEGPDSPHSVYIYSTDGIKLNKFDTGICGLFTESHLAVVSGRVYVMDEVNNNVQCRDVEGQLISEIRIKGSGSAGISVDSDNNVYVCAWWHNKVYKLDADLTRLKSVLDQSTDYIEAPDALCYYRDKLFIGHGDWSSLRNIVTVVRLL